MKTYDAWLAKLRKRAAPSGALTQWAHSLTQRQGGDSEIWREHLRAILEEEEKASPELILDLDLISVPTKKQAESDEQMPLW